MSKLTLISLVEEGTTVSFSGEEKGPLAKKGGNPGEKVPAKGKRAGSKGPHHIKWVWKEQYNFKKETRRGKKEGSPEKHRDPLRRV